MFCKKFRLDLWRVPKYASHYSCFPRNCYLENWWISIFRDYFSTYSRQRFSGLSWMVKCYYIQDYPESFRGNIETRTIASDFIRPLIESSLTRREERTDRSDMLWGQVAFYKLLTWTELENSRVGTKKIIYMEAFDIFPCYMMKFSCYSCSQLWAR